MRCEDDTIPPPERRASIFDAVDAIAAEQAALAMRPAVRRPRTLRLATAALVALLALWLPISDGIVRLDMALPFAATGTVTDTDAGTEGSAVVSASTVNSQATAPSETRQPIEMQSVTVDLADAETPVPDQQSTQPALGEGGSPDVPLGTLFQGVVQPSLRSTSTVAPSQPSRSTTPTEIIPWRDDEPVSVMVSTSYAAGVGSTIASAQNVEQVSASLAYGLSDADAIGLEFGATSYSIDQTSEILTTSEPVSSSMRMIVNGGDSNGKLASPEDEQARYSSLSQDRTAQVRSMWGSAFYERRLLDLESVAVVGRAGAGVSQEGILGFGRLTGQWNVGGGFSLVMGAEARSMPFQTGAGSRASSEISYGAIVTAITGLQVRF